MNQHDCLLPASPVNQETDLSPVKVQEAVVRLGNVQVNVHERHMCCVSDVENGAQSGTVRASEYTEQWSTFSSECVLSLKSE